MTADLIYQQRNHMIQHEHDTQQANTHQARVERARGSVCIGIIGFPTKASAGSGMSDNYEAVECDLCGKWHCKKRETA